jgi:hypothetical protein
MKTPKPLTRLTQELVMALRVQMGALRASFGEDNPAALVMGQAVSRLCLIDTTLCQHDVCLLWLNDSVIGVFNREGNAVSAAKSYMTSHGGEWRMFSSGLRWSTQGIPRLEVEIRSVQGGPPPLEER